MDVVLRLFVLISLLVSLAACAPSAAPLAAPVGEQLGRQGTQLTQMSSQVVANRIEEGLASWYGPGFAGRRTANGEIFNPSELTAAHKSLPFGTQVRVLNLENGRSVIVRINDRGPFRPGRIIDLSRAAAERLNMVSRGVARVRLELLTADGLPVLSIASFSALSSYDVASNRFARGELLVLKSAVNDQLVLVRVIRTDMPPEYNADLLVSPELYDLLGDKIVVVENP